MLANKELLNTVLRENRQLKKQCVELQRKLECVEGVRNDYKQLIEETKSLKERYLEKTGELDGILRRYQKEADRMGKGTK